MPWDISGNFTRQNTDFTGPTVWQQDQGANIKIIAARHDNHDQDLADGIQACLNLDGYNAMRAALDMGSNLIENVTDAAVDNQAVNKGQMDAADAAVTQLITNATITAATWASNVLTLSSIDGDVTVTIETFDSFKSNGAIRHRSEVFASGPTTFAADTTTGNRWTLTNTGNLTIDFTLPTGVDPDLGENYTVEGTVLVTNSGTPGVITITVGGGAVGAADVLGSNSIVAGAKSLLSYVIHRHAGDSYDEVYIWSAV
jgi:hypothetical protein